jgi:peroxiredoxin
MQCLMLGLIVFSLSAEPSAQTGGSTPEAQYESILREYNEAQTRANQAVRTAKTEAQMKEARSLYPKVEVFGPRFMALAKQYPHSAVACDALVWILSQSRHAFDVFPTRVNIMSEAMEMLARDHVDDVRVGRVCFNLSGYASPLRDQFLRAVYDKTTNREVRGYVCLYLARYLVSKSHAVETAMATAPGQRGNALRLWSDAYIEHLRSMNPTLLTWEAEELYEKTIREYGDFRNPPGSKLTFAQLAEAELKALREIGIGKTAPDIEGADIDGNVFKLSDYRGKVVVLSFSGSWCPPCRAQYPHERELVSRLKVRPFAFLSVNTDEKENLRKAIIAGEITWKCWWDGGLLGSICKAWNVHAFPTVYVIDANGVIRRRNPRGETLDKVVDELLKEIESLPKSGSNELRNGRPGERPARGRPEVRPPGRTLIAHMPVPSQATSSLTTFPCTSVSRKSLPA